MVMPPRIDPQSDTRLMQLRASEAWFAELEEWRRKQPVIPSISESVRRLVTQALEAERARITKRP